MAKKAAAQGKQICDGPSTGYRDGPKNTIQVLDLPTGFLPAGWAETWAKCKNHKDGTKPTFVKAEPE
jgi:hypothetical protein